MPKHLITGHDHFRAEYFEKEAVFLKQLATDGQTPSAIYIGCSDSRVIPELLTAAAPGELFVVRNVANLVPPYAHANASVGAAIEYAVAKLKVSHVIICGHHGCGGVRAALDGLDQIGDLPSLKSWLRGAEPAARAAEKMGLTGEALFREAVEQNVLAQMDQLISYPAVEKALDAGELALHGWIYDIADAKLQVYDVHKDEFVPSSDIVYGE